MRTEVGVYVIEWLIPYREWQSTDWRKRITHTVVLYQILVPRWQCNECIVLTKADSSCFVCAQLIRCRFHADFLTNSYVMLTQTQPGTVRDVYDGTIFSGLLFQEAGNATSSWWQFENAS
jgi:hypothetical protein